MSRSVSLRLLASNGTTVPLNNLSLPIEVRISRDSNLIIPSMTLHNVTNQNISTIRNNNRQFLLYHIDVTSSTTSLTSSVTFELKPDDLTLGYMIIFRFDGVPLLNSSINHTDGYEVVCPKSKLKTFLFFFLIFFF